MSNRSGKTLKGLSRMARKSAGSIGPGFQRDPTRGTQNPFTANLKVKEPDGPAKTPSP